MCNGIMQLLLLLERPQLEVKHASGWSPSVVHGTSGSMCKESSQQNFLFDDLVGREVKW